MGRFNPSTLPDLTGKVYIVTGGNSGIGYWTALHLAAHNAHVYLCSRSAEKGNEAIANIKKAHPSANLTLLQMDNTDLSSIVAAAKTVLSKESALHGLVNNAGIMATPYQITNDGHEAQWQTNYLSHWVFTSHLLPLLLKTSRTLEPGSVRIVNVTSSAHLGAPKGGINFADPSLKDQNAWARYGQSKLANVLHTKTLHRLYGPGSPSALNHEGEIWSACVHPGVVQTNLTATTEKSVATRWIFPVLQWMGFMMGADKGSWTSVYQAAGPMKKGESGTYMEIHGRWGEPWWESKAAKDAALAAKLEQWTAEKMGGEGWVNGIMERSG